MLTRVLTSAVGFPVLAYLIFLGGIPLKVAVSVVIIIGMYEVYKALLGRRVVLHLIGYAFAVVYVFFLDYIKNTNNMTILLISFTLIMAFLLVL